VIATHGPEMKKWKLKRKRPGLWGRLRPSLKTGQEHGGSSEKKRDSAPKGTASSSPTKNEDGRGGVDPTGSVKKNEGETLVNSALA